MWALFRRANIFSNEIIAGAEIWEDENEEINDFRSVFSSFFACYFSFFWPLKVAVHYFAPPRFRYQQYYMALMIHATKYPRLNSENC